MFSIRPPLRSTLFPYTTLFRSVATSISKTQRDFFLREQLRAIQRELGESDPNASELRSLREKIDVTPLPAEDRKSTRLNSSHMSISYAVFCLKKKKYKRVTSVI